MAFYGLRDPFSRFLNPFVAFIGNPRTVDGASPLRKDLFHRSLFTSFLDLGLVHFASGLKVAERLHHLPANRTVPWCKPRGQRELDQQSEFIFSGLDSPDMRRSGLEA